MKRNKVFLAAFSTFLLLLWLLPGGMLAQDGNQAALVIRHSDQSVQTACVNFSEPEISGLELLQRSGFDLELDVQGLGAAVCRVGQTGCPADDCWCKCKGGGDCTYWSYWQKINGQWQYSQGGASIYAVSDGDMQGWSWGPGAVYAAYPPPNLSFADVCPSYVNEVATATPTATPLVFVPADTPTGGGTQSQPTETVTSTPMSTTTSPPPATTSPVVTAVPTTTPIPTVAAPTAPATQETYSAPVGPEPAITTTVPAEEPLVSVERDFKTAETAPPATLPDSREAAQPTPEPAPALAVADGQLPTRIGEQETKKRVEFTADPPPRLTVVGTGAQIPDLTTLTLAPEEEIDGPGEKNGSNSLVSYILFGLIVLGLVGWLIITSHRRQEKPVYFKE